METILIGDTVIATTGTSHPYEGKEGEVIASRRDSAAGAIEHRVMFPQRVFTQEEMDLGADLDAIENVVWLRADEIAKAVS